MAIRDEWKELAASGEFQSLTPEERESRRSAFFDEKIAPRFNESQRGYARRMWDQETLQAKQVGPQTTLIPESQSKETDNAFEYSIDQAQKLVGRGIQATGELVGSETVGDFGKGVVEQQERDIEEGGYQSAHPKSLSRTFEEDGAWEATKAVGTKVAENAATTGASLLGSVAALATAPFSVPVATAIGLGTAGLTWLMGTGEVAQEMEDSGGEVNNAMAVGVGAGVAMLDRFGAGKVLPKAKLGELAKRMGSMSGKELVEELRSAGAKEAADGIQEAIVKGANASKASLFRRAAKGFGYEGLTESMQESLIMTAAGISGGEYTPREVVDGIIDSFAIGGVMGAMASPASNGHTPEQQRARLLQDPDARPADRIAAARVYAKELQKSQPALAAALVNHANKRAMSKRPFLDEGETFYDVIQPIERHNIDQEVKQKAEEILALPSPSKMGHAPISVPPTNNSQVAGAPTWFGAGIEGQAATGVRAEDMTLPRATAFVKSAKQRLDAAQASGDKSAVERIRFELKSGLSTLESIMAGRAEEASRQLIESQAEYRSKFPGLPSPTQMGHAPISASEPAEVTAAREQRQADDFSARYGQEGITPYRPEAVTGELDRSAELPSPEGAAALPPGTGQIDMGRERPERTFTAAPDEYEGVGRNIVERQANGNPVLPTGSPMRTITPEQFRQLQALRSEGLRTKLRERSAEQVQAIQITEAVKAGDVVVSEAGQPNPDEQGPGQDIAGEPIDHEWTRFAPQSGTLNVPRSDMPQVAAEHRGALVNFLDARGIEHEQVEVDPLALKPTQAEFSPAKVQRARNFSGGDRSILISADGHVVDGHHQWMSKREGGEPVKAIQLNAPIADLVPLIKEFPSSAVDDGAGRTQDKARQAVKQYNREPNPDTDDLLAAIALGGGIRRDFAEGVDPADFNRRAAGIRLVFPKTKGRSLDDMAEYLSQYGYVSSVSDLQAKLDRALRGHTVMTPEGAVQQIEREAQEESRFQEAEDNGIETEALVADDVNLARNAGVPDAVISDILNRNSNDAVLAVVELKHEAEQAQAASVRSREGDAIGEREADIPWSENQPLTEQDAADIWGQPDTDEQPLLTAYTEADLTERENTAAESERQRAREQREAEQKVQADRDANDFTLTGSERPADQAMAQGQGDIFGAAPPSPQTAEAKADIEDFGEKLGGARKDELRTVRERLDSMDDEAIASSTLSKMWPRSEIDKIEDPVSAAIYQAARDEIPNKPRVAYKLKRWVGMVKQARELLTSIDQLGSSGKLIDRLRGTGQGFAQFADKVDLLTAIERSQWGRIGRVSKQTGRYSVGNGELVPGSWYVVEIDGRRQSFYGADQVSEVIPGVKEKLNSAQKERRVKFEIRQHRHSGKVFINKAGDSEQRALKEFEDLKAARNYLNDNHDDLVRAWEAVKNRDNVSKADMRRRTNEERVGADYRDGQDVTPEQFLDTFGFRGVEFGNWVKQGKGGKERQGMLNDAFDALMDLANVLQIPPKAISLEGRLGIGFGSRGSGSASAHFEPDMTVINLTKTKGAGSLAHEWFHALDNYFALKRGGVEFAGDQKAYRERSYITYRPEPMLVYKKGNTRYKLPRAEVERRRARDPDGMYAAANWEPDTEHPQGVRPQVEKAFAELVKTLNASPMKQRSETIDKGKVDGYWSRIIERGARAFETYVIASLANNGHRNDYLANVRSLEEFARSGDRYPYLTPEEQTPVNEAFDKLFNTVDTKETDSGVALFSRTESADVPLSRDEVERIASGITADWANAPNMEVVASDTALPAKVQADMDEQGARGKVDGVFHNGTFYLVAGKIRTPEDVERIVFHEALGHYGLRQLYGSTMGAHLDKLFFRIGGLNGISRLQKRYGFNLSPYWVNSQHMSAGQRRELMMDELVAHLAAKGDIEPSLIQKIAHAVRQGLRKLFKNTRFAERLDKLSDVEVLEVVAAARRAVTEGKASVDYLTHDPRFVRRFNELMYSRIDGDRMTAGEGQTPKESTMDLLNKYPHFKATEDGDDVTILFHDSPQQEAFTVSDDHSSMGVDFGGIFAGPDGGMGGRYRHAVILSDNQILTIDEFAALDETSDEVKAAMRKAAPWMSDEQIEDAWPFIAETESLFDANVDTEVLFREEDAGEASWEAQRIRGQVARALGYQAVEMSDETGTSTLVFPGVTTYPLQDGESSREASGRIYDEWREWKQKLDTATSAESAGALPESITTTQVRYSRTDSTNFAMPDETLVKVALRKIADKFQVLKDLQKNIEQAGGTVSEEGNAYRAEELFHGKAEEDLRQMREALIAPLAEKMAKFGISQEDLDQYLYAKHAPERNAHIAEINPNLPDGGSGMTNARAEEILSMVRESGKEGKYEQLAKIVYDMLASRRDMIREAGLEEEGLVDAWESGYDAYVPLKGFAENEKQEGLPRSGQGFNIRGRESQRAMGRSSLAASPSSQSIQDLTEAILRKRKNEVGNSLLKLVEENPNPDYWQVYTADNPEKGPRLVTLRDANGDIVEQVTRGPKPMAMLAERYFTTKRDGKTYYIRLEDPRLMKAMKNIGPDTSNFVIRTLGAINRVLSSLNTSYNPEFVVGNFSRDVQTAILNLTAEETREDGKIKGERIAGQTVKDIPKAMKAVYRGLRGKSVPEGASGEWQRWFTEFREAGAKTGWFDMKDLDGQSKDLEHLIAIANGGFKGSALKWSQSASKVVEDINGAVENAVRLSAYVNARKAGIGKDQAASLAKNMTVNFNRRGEAGTTLNALYMFANASIQGSMNFVRTMAGLKGKKGDPVWSRLNTAQKIAAGAIIGSYAIAMVNRMAAGDDDDGENWYDKIPDYVKERNLVIMKSLLGGEQDGSYWKIPLPYGYNIFSVLGTSAEGVTNGNTSVGKAATDLTLATLGSFSPIGFQDSESGVGLMLKNITPTLGKPLVDVALNENFMGSSIYNENFPFGVPKPDSSLARRSTPEGYKAIAEFLNDVSGGSQWRSGAIDINPDVMRYYVDYFLGGAGKFVLSKVPDNAYNLANGVEMEPHQQLFLSRVNGRVLPYEDMDRFYTRRDEIGQIAEEFKGLRGAERMEFGRDHRGKLALQSLIKATEKQLKGFRQQRDAIYRMDLSPAEQDKRLEVIEKRMKTAVDQFNRAYKRAAE